MKREIRLIKELFYGDGQFVFPRLHRPYCWDGEQFEMFWHPISVLGKEGDWLPFYIGTIVTEPVKADSKIVEKVNVLDGKQRIFTVYILLTVVRDMAKAKGLSSIAEEIHDNYLVNWWPPKKFFQKIICHPADRKNLTCLVEGKEKTGNSQIFKCYNFLEEKIKKSNLSAENVMGAVLRLTVGNIIVEKNDDGNDILENIFKEKIEVSPKRLIFVT